MAIILLAKQRRGKKKQ